MDHEQILAEHRRLIDRDPAAPSRIVELLLQPLVNFVRKAVPGVTDPHDIEECCLEALLHYLKDPTRYNPGKSQLFTWLAGLARWQALTRWRNLKRRWKRDNFISERIQDQRAADDKEIEGEIIDVITVHRIVNDHLDELVKEEGDLDLLFLIAAGVRETSDYLDALGLADTPKNRMAALGRRERVRGRLRRLKERLVIKPVSHELACWLVFDARVGVSSLQILENLPCPFENLDCLHSNCLALNGGGPNSGDQYGKWVNVDADSPVAF